MFTWFASFKTRFFGKTNPRTIRKNRPIHARLLLETLEDRVTPTTVTAAYDGVATLNFTRTGTGAETVEIISNPASNQVKFDLGPDGADLSSDPNFISDGGSIWETNPGNSVSINFVVVNLTAGNSTLKIDSGWDFLSIPITYTGTGDTDTLDVSGAAPQAVIADTLDGAGFDGNDSNLTFSKLDSVVFGGDAGDLLDVGVNSGSSKNATYTVSGPGAGTVLVGTSSLQFSGLNNATQYGVILSNDAGIGT